MVYPPGEIFDNLRRELSGIGYSTDLVFSDYKFNDVLSGGDLRTINLAGFAQHPPSIETACVGFVLAEAPTPAYVSKFKALGAPYIFTVRPSTGKAAWWAVAAEQGPKLIREIEVAKLIRFIQKEEETFSPDAVLRAKYGDFESPLIQLPLFDPRFFPVLERESQHLLDRLLQRVLEQARETYQATTGGALTDQDSLGLFRLIFRFLAAKMLADRNHPGEWLASDPEAVIRNVEDHYFPSGHSEPVLSLPTVQRVIWDIIRDSFHLQNISPKALAYVYENTFVNEKTRQEQDIHATPPAVAEFVMQKLPFEDFDERDRYIFEPFAGHAPFLVAGLGRLRSLLPGTMSRKEKHRYLRERLLGVELDGFAYEVARYSLTLADYPNRNDWLIRRDDAFSSSYTKEYLVRARAVVCNPPFGSLTPAEQSKTGSQTPLKAVEALRMVVAKRPDMLGFILPRSFFDGKSYRSIRQAIDVTYAEVHTLTLPESAFQKQEFPTVVLLAYGARQNGAVRSSASLSPEEYKEFVATRQIPTGKRWEWTQAVPAPSTDVTVFSKDRLHAEISSATAHLALIGELTEMHRGYEWDDGITGHIHADEGPDRVPGLHTVKQHLEPLYLRRHVYLDNNPDTAGQYPWGRSKVFVNANRHSRGAWTLSAAVDPIGLACTENFIGVWAKNDKLSPEVLAAVLSGPLANFLVKALRGPASRHNQIRHIEHVPFPDLSPTEINRLCTLVNTFRKIRQQHQKAPTVFGETLQRSQSLLYEIDALVLKGYSLPPRTEWALLEEFKGSKRPGFVKMDRYYPTGFSASVPLHMFLSEDFQDGRVDRTRERRGPGVSVPGLNEWLD